MVELPIPFRRLIAPVVLLALAAAAPSAFAQVFDDLARPSYDPAGDSPPPYALRHGKVSLHPHAEVVAWGYDDNVYLDANNAVDDTLYSISPGVLLRYGGDAEESLWADYTYEMIRYADESAADSDNQVLSAGFRLSPGRWTLDGRHESADVRGAEVEIGERLEVQEHLTALSAERQISSKTSAAALYDQWLYDYRNDAYIDSREYRIGARAYWHALPQTDVFGEYAYGWVDLEPTSAEFADATYHEISAGLRRPVTSRLTGTGRVGYQYRTFEDDVEDVNHWTARFDLGGQLPRRIYGDVQLYGAFRPSLQTAGVTAIDTGLSASLSKKLWGERLLASVNGSVGSLDWRGPDGDLDRQDDYWGVGASLDYLIRRGFTVGADVSHGENDSNLDDYSFERNQATVRAGLNF